MKWYRNKPMLNETFEQNINFLQKTKSEKTKWLLMDYNNLIKDHLELLDENERLKKILDILKYFISVSNEVDFDTFIVSNYDDDVIDLIKKVINNE